MNPINNLIEESDELVEAVKMVHHKTTTYDGKGARGMNNTSSRMKKTTVTHKTKDGTTNTYQVSSAHHKSDDPSNNYQQTVVFKTSDKPDPMGGQPTVRNNKGETYEGLPRSKFFNTDHKAAARSFARGLTGKAPLDNPHHRGWAYRAGRAAAGHPNHDDDSAWESVQGENDSVLVERQKAAARKRELAAQGKLKPQKVKDYDTLMDRGSRQDKKDFGTSAALATNYARKQDRLHHATQAAGAERTKAVGLSLRYRSSKYNPKTDASSAIFKHGLALGKEQQHDLSKPNVGDAHASKNQRKRGIKIHIPADNYRRSNLNQFKRKPTNFDETIESLMAEASELLSTDK